MNRYYDHLARYERKGFEIIVDKTFEDEHPRDSFDDTCYDIQDICRKIDSGQLDWFMLRVRVLVAGHELGRSYLGSCLYEDAREVLVDGTAEDQIHMAMTEAINAGLDLKDQLVELCLEERLEECEQG